MKPTILKTLSIITAVTCVFLAMLSVAARADMPYSMAFQGKLTDSDGQALTGTYSITFSLYDAANNLKWVETQDVLVANGLYNVELGKTNTLAGLPFTEPYWLEIKVGTETLSPRTKLMSAPYTFYTNYAATASSATYIINNSSWNDLTDGGVTSLHSHASGVPSAHAPTHASGGADPLGAGSIVGSMLADNTISPVKLSTAAAYNLYGSTLTIYSVVASSGITAAKYYGDGSGLSNINGTDSQVRVSTGIIQSQLNQVALSTGNIQSQANQTSLSTGTIKAQLDQVVLSTGTLIRLNGTLPMTGNLDLGGNDTTNVFVITVSTVSAYYVKASTIGLAGITKFYGDGSSLSGISMTDSAVRLSTGVIQADLATSTTSLRGRIDAVALSTGSIQSQLNSVALSTGVIQSDLAASTSSLSVRIDAVALSTGSIQSQLNSVALSTGVIQANLAASTTSLSSRIDAVDVSTGALQSQIYTMAYSTQSISLGGYVVLTDVGASYDATGASNGLGVAEVNFDNVKRIEFMVRVNKIGAGTQSWQLYNETDTTQIGVIDDAGATGVKTLSTSITSGIPTGLKTIRVRAMSDTATDDPEYYGASVRIIR